MSEKISKKQEKVQEKIQKQQELNDDKSRELTDEELDQIVGGTYKPDNTLDDPLKDQPYKPSYDTWTYPQWSA